ncbi:hypothetical protein D1872_263110 [compost metagenome]
MPGVFGREVFEHEVVAQALDIDVALFPFGIDTYASENGIFDVEQFCMLNNIETLFGIFDQFDMEVFVAFLQILIVWKELQA